MALHHTLPIYRDTRQLLQLVVELVRHFPRDLKPSLGHELTKECVRMITLIYRANAADDKAPHIAGLREKIIVVESLLQLAADLKQPNGTHIIGKMQHAATMRLTASCGKQASGWEKSSKPHSPNSRRGTPS